MISETTLVNTSITSIGHIRNHQRKYINHINLLYQKAPESIHWSYQLVISKATRVNTSITGNSIVYRNSKLWKIIIWLLCIINCFCLWHSIIWWYRIIFVRKKNDFPSYDFMMTFHHIMTFHHMMIMHHKKWSACPSKGLPASEGPDRTFLQYSIEFLTVR